MSRTITPSEERHRAPQEAGPEAAPGRNTSIRPIIEESVDCCAGETTEGAAALVAAAQRRSGLSDDDAMSLAVEETRAERRR